MWIIKGCVDIRAECRGCSKINIPETKYLEIIKDTTIAKHIATLALIESHLPPDIASIIIQYTKQKQGVLV